MVQASGEALDKAFQAAQTFISTSDSKTGPKLSNSDKLEFYSLFKQASVGPCTGKQPSRLNIVARAKYDAWKALGKLSKDDAKRRFIQLL